MTNTLVRTKIAPMLMLPALLGRPVHHQVGMHAAHVVAQDVAPHEVVVCHDGGWAVTSGHEICDPVLWSVEGEEGEEGGGSEKGCARTRFASRGRQRWCGGAMVVQRRSVVVLPHSLFF